MSNHNSTKIKRQIVLAEDSKSRKKQKIWVCELWEETQVDRLVNKFGEAKTLEEALIRVGCPKSKAKVGRWFSSKSQSHLKGYLPVEVIPYLEKAARLEGIYLVQSDFDPRAIQRKRCKLRGFLTKEGVTPFFPPAERPKVITPAFRTKMAELKEELETWIEMFEC